MHKKSDSEGTSDTSWAPRSPRRPMYYVQSPSNHDVEKLSCDGSTPIGSPQQHYYHCSPIHHSRESSTSRFSASLKNPRSLTAWKHVPISQQVRDDDDDDDYDDGFYGPARNLRLYLCGLLLFVMLFTVFCVILWGASKAYEPEIFVKNMVFENFNVQAGIDQTGVPTDMLTLNSTVKIHYRNPSTFFAVHVTSTPFDLHYFQLKMASGQMKKFSQRRKSGRMVVGLIQASQVPIYGGVPVLANAKEHLNKVAVPLNLTFVMRSRAYILGRLVKSKFYKRIRCPVILRGNKLGKPLNMTNSCLYE